MGGVKPRKSPTKGPNRTRGTRDESPAINEQWTGASLRAGELQAGTGTSPGKPGESGSGRDDRRGTARAPARALASRPGTASERDLQAATGETGIHSKPGGGRRKLGIPTVLDRFVQQAVAQVMQQDWDRTFSAHSYGFRPGRSAHQAVEAVQQQMAAGRRWVVDLDLEKFFDRVNHDRLMARMARRIGDKQMLKLVRAFLTAGVMEDGLVSPVDEGTPQGGPLSPLLSNIVLDELDRELERRGLAVRTVRGRLQHLCGQSSGPGNA